MNRTLPRIEIVSKWHTFYFYDKHQDHFCASMHMFVDGDSGYVTALGGTGFFATIGLFHKKIFVKRIKYVYFNMMEDTLIAFWRVSEPFYEFKDLGSFKRNGRKFVKVRINLKRKR